MVGKQTGQALVAALLGAAMLASAQPADAASRTCRQLRAELAAATGARGKPRLIAKYDDAIARQHREIDKARSQSRRANCFFALFGSDRAQCAMLDAALKRMDGNLAKLEKKRAGLAGGGSSRERRRIMARLDASGCNDKPAQKPKAAVPAEARPSASDEGKETGRVRRVLDPRHGIIEIPPPRQVTGEYRTLCVRTCDGYFFPMSNAATLGDFERDRKNCESSCPGTEMRVFYSRGMGTDSADMISAATGRPYSELPTAYLYKRADVTVPRCGCRTAGDFSVIGGASAPARPRGQAVSSSIVSFPPPEAPTRKPVREAGAATAPQAEKVPLSEKQRNVRVVGPRFLPDPEEAIDLQAPAPTKGP